MCQLFMVVSLTLIKPLPMIKQNSIVTYSYEMSSEQLTDAEPPSSEEQSYSAQTPSTDEATGGDQGENETKKDEGGNKTTAPLSGQTKTCLIL
uniref:Uncharacterized protein n=1 Tax=Amphimedon queenslandica TaxID=400682 RepID=A0A1X7TXD2_AMPQE